MEGTITCNRDGLLYTSIPQDGNWSVTVDGEAVEEILVGDAMIAVPLTEGDHTLRFTYRNNAFTLGLMISLSSALIFVILAYTDHQKQLPKGKYAKKG